MRKELKKEIKKLKKINKKFNESLNRAIRNEEYIDIKLKELEKLANDAVSSTILIKKEELC